MCVCVFGVYVRVCVCVCVRFLCQGIGFGSTRVLGFGFLLAPRPFWFGPLGSKAEISSGGTAVFGVHKPTNHRLEPLPCAHLGVFFFLGNPRNCVPPKIEQENSQEEFTTSICGFPQQQAHRFGCGSKPRVPFWGR